MKMERIQEAAPAVVDTLTRSYSDQWNAMEHLDEASGFVRMMASNDLLPVVLGVSLIIWFVLLFFLIRLDRKVGRLENLVNAQEHHQPAGE